MTRVLHSLLALAYLTTMPACPAAEDDAESTVALTEATTADSTSGAGSTATSATSTTSATDPDETTTAPTSDTDEAPNHTLAGVVRLGDGVELVGDGVGTLIVGAFLECGKGQTLAGFAAVPGADLSARDAAVPFEIAGLPASKIYLGYFLDDNGDADLAKPEAGEGDPAYAEEPCDGILSCVEVDLSGGDLSDVALELNLVHPACP